MYKKRLLGTALLAGMAAFAGGAVQAAPMIEVEIFDNNLAVGPPVYGPTASGNLVISTSDANFSTITVAVTGIPLVPSPDLGTITTQATSATGGTHVLTVLATQYNTPFSQGGLVSTFTSNALIAGGVPTQFANWADIGGGGGTPFAATSGDCGISIVPATACNVNPAAILLATATLPSGVVGAGGPFTSVVGAGPESETEVMATTFTAPLQSVALSDQIVGVAVPEPFSMALLGTGLVGVGLVRRRRAR